MKLDAPIALMYARDTLPAYQEVTNLLAKLFSVEPMTVRGRHGFYYYRPQDLVDALQAVPKCFAKGWDAVPELPQRDFRLGYLRPWHRIGADGRR